MRQRSPWSTLLLPLVGCVKFDTKPVGDFALSFSGAPDCASAGVQPERFPEVFTIEAWVKGEEQGGVQPLVVWTGAFALYQDTDGFGWLAEDGPDALGVTFSGGWNDGELHHVAATWNGAEAAIFLDGAQMGLASGAAIGAEAAATLSVGCWQGKDASHSGTIDEVQFSRRVRYGGDFERPAGPFVADADTLYLWHFDDGEGRTALDDMGRADLSLKGTTWVEQSLSASDTGS
jgi:hypothetical protein